LPISTPTEFGDGSSGGGRCSSPPVEWWSPPDSALVDVLLPDSATPIQPTVGARIRNVEPIWADPVRHRDGHARVVEHVGEHLVSSLPRGNQATSHPQSSYIDD
jgi:hypothetical protein